MTHFIGFALGVLLAIAVAAEAQTMFSMPEHCLGCHEGALTPTSAEGKEPVTPEATPIEKKLGFTSYGDLRLRYELDWDSLNTAGAMRASRNRGRLRARAGFNYQVSEAWSFGGRVRSGSTHSQQSPHLTFAGDDGVRDNASVVADRYFVQFNHRAFSVWGGRDTSPFWQQNELFWDEDVTSTGVAGAYQMRIGPGNVTATAGAFYVPDGGYRLNGQMTAGQLKYSLASKRSQFTFASGLHYLHGRKGARYLLNRDGERDYLIGVNSAQWSVPVKKVPLILGADLFHNFMDYGSADVAPFPATERNQTLGYALSAQLGQLKKHCGWLAGYCYAHIERFAVNASYAQDDWIRFGNGTQTEASDFQGSEMRSGYAVSRNVNLLARLYLVQAIGTRQNGSRFRLDLNWKF
ncbi:MAG TPA: putative porin [Bryobacteraceae bacterium]|nr:putative porin [Bryobacteraceae bacterium]